MTVGGCWVYPMGGQIWQWAMTFYSAYSKCSRKESKEHHGNSVESP